VMCFPWKTVTSTTPTPLTSLLIANYI
jgi:hypothetical protein